jgi:hypothetical protein
MKPDIFPDLPEFLKTREQAKAKLFYPDQQAALQGLAQAAQYYLDSESTTAECDRRFKAALEAAKPFLKDG